MPRVMKLSYVGVSRLCAYLLDCSHLSLLLCLQVVYWEVLLMREPGVHMLISCSMVWYQTTQKCTWHIGMWGHQLQGIMKRPQTSRDVSQSLTLNFLKSESKSCMSKSESQSLKSEPTSQSLGSHSSTSLKVLGLSPSPSVCKSTNHMQFCMVLM